MLPQVGYSTLVYPHHNNDYSIRYSIKHESINHITMKDITVVAMKDISMRLSQVNVI
jgi:hypothetical protein